MNEIKGHYESYYSQNYLSNAKGRHCYPVEFVVRTFLGSSYPQLKLDRQFAGKKILDLGCGDGRNIPMLANCGLEISGVEITEGICQSVADRMNEVFKISCDIRCGTNAHIPFPNNHFDYLLACHSIYYVEEKTRFSDNLSELARVMKSGAYAVLSLPDSKGTILKNAISNGEGHFRITSDPLSLRDGSQFKVFENKDDIYQEFSPLFDNICIGHCAEDYYGYFQSMWIVCMRRKDRL